MFASLNFRTSFGEFSLLVEDMVTELSLSILSMMGLFKYFFVECLLAVGETAAKVGSVNKAPAKEWFEKSKM